MNVGSLFSGIGGLDLGLERAGMTVRWQSEIDPYCVRVLAKHWPTVPNLGDVTTIDWSQVEPVDLIAGGYPCQPFSLAGARGGEADDRHLWPRFADAIRHLRPRFALLENVPGHLSLGFGSVLGDLAELGYDAEWDCIPAAAVGAPHLRYRIFVVAYPHVDEHESGASAIGRQATTQLHPNTDGGGLEVGAQLDGQPIETAADGHPRRQHADGLRDDVADAAQVDGEERQHRIGAQEPGQRRALQVAAQGSGRDVADPEVVRCGPLRAIGAGQAGPDDLAGHAGELARGDAWAVEPDVGRVAHGVPRRVDRLRALGNAVVPQVAEYIGRRILEAAA